MRKLYITDLDGTLLAENGKMSEFGIRLLNQLISEGILIAIATGRSLISAADILADTHLHMPIISNNGARISMLDTMRHVYSNFMDPQIAQEVLDVLLEHYMSPFINGDAQGNDVLLHEKEINQGTQMFIDIRRKKEDPRLKQIDRYDRLEGIRVINFNIIDQTSKLMEVETLLNQRYGTALDMHITFEPTWAEWGWLTISDAKSNKADGIKALISEYIHEEVEVTVFGDQRNDIHMVEYADRGIAVANARPELKAVADLVIGPNKEDSVLRFIAKEQGIQIQE